MGIEAPKVEAKADKPMVTLPGQLRVSKFSRPNDLLNVSGNAVAVDADWDPVMGWLMTQVHAPPSGRVGGLH
jgi:hypothetical protein